MQSQSLPSAFVDHMKELLPEDYPLFEESLASPPPVSIRFNPSRGEKDIVAHLPLETPVPWHPNGWYLKQRPSFTLDPLFHAGAYYVQEASSMLLYQALSQTCPSNRPLRILDLCAAPGGKTTLIASWMPKGSVLIANEVIRSRVSILKQNLTRWGNPNIFTCNYDPEAFLPLAGWFDIVVADAPCSGEGLFRKNDLATGEWSPSGVELCSARQKRILDVAQRLISPGGTLIYSTCTYNRLENDANVEWLTNTRGMHPLDIETPAEWGVTPRGNGYQMYPHRARGEGFFLAALKQLEPIRANEKRKKEFRKLSEASKKEVEILKDWVSSPADHRILKSPDGRLMHAPAHLVNDLLTLDLLLPQGVWFHETGEIKGTNFIPSHATALLSGFLRKDFPSVELSEQQALLYLKKELQEIPISSPGWVLVTYQNQPLGWIRNLGNRFNNYYPTEQRIRMDVRQNV